jgi:hypothetical protein
MMQTENYRKYIILSMAIALLFLLIEVILFWNAFVAEKPWPVVLPFICVLIVVLALGYALNTSFKATNPKLISDYINKEISEERYRIIKELEKKEDAEQQNNNTEIIENSIKEIIPKGNYKNIDSLLAKFLKNLGNTLEIVQGILYLKEENAEEFVFKAGYALTDGKTISAFKIGETLPGQVAQTGDITYINDIPDEYFLAESGLGKARPNHIIFIPIQSDNTVVAVLELAVFKKINSLNKEILKQLTHEISNKLAQTIKS